MFSEKIRQLAIAFAGEVADLVGAETQSEMQAKMAGLFGGEAPASPQRSTKIVKEKADKSGKGGKGGRLARRSPEEIAAVVADVVKLVRKHKDGLRSETIRQELGLDVREVPRVLKDGIASGALKVLSGQKRSTCYGAGSGRKPAVRKAPRKAKASSKTTSKKPATKKAKKTAKPAKSRATKPRAAKSKTANGVAEHTHAAPAEATT